MAEAWEPGDASSLRDEQDDDVWYESSSSETADNAPSYREEVENVFQKSKQEFKANEESVKHARHRLKIMVSRACSEIQAKEKEEIAKIKIKSGLLIDKVTEIGKKRDEEFVKVHTNNKERMERAETALTSDFECLQLEKVDHGKSFTGFKSQDAVNDYELGEILIEKKWELKTMFPKVEQGNFNCAMGVGCFSNGDIAVNDTKNKQLSIFSSTGHYKAKFDLNAPHGIAVTSDDVLLAHCKGHVKVFDRNHRLMEQFKLPQDDREDQRREGVLTGGITVDNKNQVAVVHRKTGVTSLHNLDGSLIKVIQNTKVVPTDIVANKECLIFATLDRSELRCVDLNGKELFNVSTSVNGKDAKPVGVCCDDAGDIYVTLRCGKRGGIGEVHHYDSQGFYVDCVTKELWWPFGITFSPNGELVVADKLSVKIFQEFCPENGTFKCNEENCEVCKTHIRESSSFSGYSSNTTHKTIGLITCTTSNVIYLITCKVCKEQYVGETIQTLKKRFSEHQSYVRTKKLNYPTGYHFNLPGHSKDDMILQGIQSFRVRDDRVRRSKEQEWMDRLGTKDPHGLNIR